MCACVYMYLHICRIYINISFTLYVRHKGCHSRISIEIFWTRIIKKTHLGNSGCQIQMTVIPPFSKLSPAIKFSLFPWNRLPQKTQEAKVIDTEEISHSFPFPVWFGVICILLCGALSGIVYYTAVWTAERHKIAPTTAAMRARKREE